jgi:hypothetical protein
MPTVNSNTNILDNFVRLINEQIIKYSQYNDNTEIIDRLFQSFSKAFNGLRRMIDAEAVKKYNELNGDLQKKYAAKKEEVNKLLEQGENFVDAEPSPETL